MNTENKGTARINFATMIATYVIAVCAVAAIIVAVFTEALPTTERLRKVVVEENGKLLKKTDTCVKKQVDAGADRVIVKLVIFQKDPTYARNKVYQDALERAEENGYISLIGEGYLTTESYQEEVWRLLTPKERNLIKRCFERYKDKNLLGLMDAILSDNTIARELSIVESYDVKVGPGKKFAYNIMPYDKIGIIGGYIAELKFGLAVN